MRMALEIVVVTIILLVVAIVVLMFFANGMRAGVDMTDARNQCITMASASCKSLKVLPPTWFVPTVTVEGKTAPESCDDITEGAYKDCSKFGVTGGGATTGGTTTITTNTQCTTALYTCEASCTAPKTQKGTCDADPAKKACCG
ncbi:MAG: hypothetical protein NTU57_05235 [Candidatus Aenigmarchaeota archaeon]|nr:hypothetical protein [Candidatus Aenigmarchaeota archaeon]